MKLNLRNGGASRSRIIVPTSVIFVLFSLFFCAEFVNGQQRVIWLFKPTKSSSPSNNRNYHGENRMSSSENEINTGEGNFRPIYFFNHLHDRSTHVPVSDSARFLHHPHIAPIIITDYERNPRPKALLPQHFSSNNLDERGTYNGGGEAGFSRKKNDNVFMINRNGHKYNHAVSTWMSQEEQEEDDNNSSNSSGSSEFGIEKFSDLRHHNQPDISPPPKLTSSENVIITHPYQRCILEGHQARFDPITGGCHTVGTKGPCGKFMIFTTIPNDNLNGYCDCDYDSFDRPMALLGGKCHFLYTQAVCYPGYWLTSITSDGDPICEENPCQVQSSSSVNPSKNSAVLYKGECLALNSPSIHCRREGEVVLFPKGSTQPACGFPKSTKRIYRRQISNVSRLMCRPGMRRHRVTKRCVRTRAIVFH